MVRLTRNPRRRAASCWQRAGYERRERPTLGFFLSDLRNRERKRLQLSDDSLSILSVCNPVRLAVFFDKLGGKLLIDRCGKERCDFPKLFRYEGFDFPVPFHNSRSATDWTRPAERPENRFSRVWG